MPTCHWDIFNNIKKMAGESNDRAVAEKVDSILSAAMESIADTLPTATADLLQEGAIAARNALEAYERLDSVDELSPSFAAGRLAAAVDVLGYASYQTANDAILKLAQAYPYGSVLAALMEGPMRSVDLAAKLEKDEPRMSKWLATLREYGAVTSQKHGRVLISALTPAGRVVVETGWQDERRAPLQTSNIVDMASQRYNLNTRVPPTDVGVSEMPRISASGS